MKKKKVSVQDTMGENQGNGQEEGGATNNKSKAERQRVGPAREERRAGRGTRGLAGDLKTRTEPGNGQRKEWNATTNKPEAERRHVDPAREKCRAGRGTRGLAGDLTTRWKRGVQQMIHPEAVRQHVKAA
jgi:hypothetical protein